MIRTRIGVAAALVISIAALALGLSAFMSTVRDDGPTVGRLVQTRLTNEYTGPFQPFPLDEFYIGPGGDGRLHAYYVYPPGYYGHVRGCKVVWDNTATLTVGGATYGPGLFLDPCGGARFTRRGDLVAGPADRGLDWFETSAGIEGTFADTRRLHCGEVPTPIATPAEAPTATATAPAPFSPPPLTPAGSTTPTATSTRTATPTETTIPTDTATATPASLSCPRVTPNTP